MVECANIRVRWPSVSPCTFANDREHYTVDRRMPTKKEMQQQYRLKETQGFADLHHALYAVNPQLPIRRDVPRYQLLLLAAEQIRRLAEDRQKLTDQLTYLPPTPSQAMYFTPAEVANSDDSADICNTHFEMLGAYHNHIEQSRLAFDCTNFGAYSHLQGLEMTQYMGG